MNYTELIEELKKNSRKDNITTYIFKFNGNYYSRTKDWQWKSDTGFSQGNLSYAILKIIEHCETACRCGSSLDSDFFDFRRWFDFITADPFYGEDICFQNIMYIFENGEKFRLPVTIVAKISGFQTIL